MPDIKGSDEKEPGRREFMREKIVKPPLSKMQILKRMAAFLCLAALFGVIAAVSFVLSAPLAEQYLGKERQAESSSVMFSKDEPETVIPETSKVETTAPEQGEKDMEETILEALSGYPFTMDNLASLYDLLREVSQQADKGIVTVRSGKQQTDLFGNLVENTGDYAGGGHCENRWGIPDIHLCGRRETSGFYFGHLLRRNGGGRPVKAGG